MSELNDRENDEIINFANILQDEVNENINIERNLEIPLNDLNDNNIDLDESSDPIIEHQYNQDQNENDSSIENSDNHLENFQDVNEDEIDQDDEYENIDNPISAINNIDCLRNMPPSSHNYLGQNFHDISTPKLIHKVNDLVSIPLLYLPGNSITSFDDENNVQLLPGQFLPIYFYSPLQVQVIKKRMKDPDPTVGFSLCPKHIRNVLLQHSNRDQENIKLDSDNLGVLAEIISVSREISEEEEPESDSLLGNGMGMVIKVKGRERFEILEISKDITGCVIANVKILPDYVFNVNPLTLNCPKNTQYFYENYFNLNNVSLTDQNLSSKAEYLNFCQSNPAWVFRKYDCNYLIYLIKKELKDTFGLEFNTLSAKLNDKMDSSMTDPLIFSLWLLNNFPLDNKSRINSLKMNCVNQRLMYIYSLLKNYTNIVCKNCKNILCAKSDAFSISKSFMNAFLNPGGVIHETLTVFKLKNFTLAKEAPSLLYTWFPGYGWQIMSCRACQNHIGWKFTAVDNDAQLKKFYGLTRKSIGYAYVDENNKSELE